MNNKFFEWAGVVTAILYSLFVALNIALEFFYPRLVVGGVILFDDYGWDAYEDTKNTIENFFKDKPGLLMKIPTGQAIYFHN